VKTSFAFICLVRVIQGLVFIGVLQEQNTPAGYRLDSVIRYWIPDIAINLMFSAESVLLYYW